MPDSPHPSIRWAFSLRTGGVSRGVWAGTPSRADGLNLGSNCGDDPGHVAQNRQRIADFIGQPVSWLAQVHGRQVFDLDVQEHPLRSVQAAAEADAQVCSRPGIALAVLVADCLPVLLADRQGRVIGAAHAGWRGLAGGVLEATVQRMCSHADVDDLVAWLGPCIGPAAFEVGDDVLDAFLASDAGARTAFRPGAEPGKWWADLPLLARRRLSASGVGRIIDSHACTCSDPTRFYSYRRDHGACGRMAGLIWFAG
ncbi:MAG: peptidoglycan editing factor PgeF [Lautropia sp.]|nr:peptidoglycan editing factor PgeF [Lautropia sp.]